MKSNLKMPYKDRFDRISEVIKICTTVTIPEATRWVLVPIQLTHNYKQAWHLIPAEPDSLASVLFGAILSRSQSVRFEGKYVP